MITGQFQQALFPNRPFAGCQAAETCSTDRNVPASSPKEAIFDLQL